MKKDWVSPKIILGSVATGNYYFPREELVEEIWFELEKGNFVLMAAPRRVGKTSVMKYLEENPKENYKTVFKDIQSVTSEDEFYKTLFLLILKCLGSSKQNSKLFKSYLKSIGIKKIEILKGGIEFSKLKIDYLKEINHLLTEIDIENGETIVLLIDELPEVLHYLNKQNQKDQAISILKNLRTWRQENKYKKLKFVLAGSIGIHYVVTTIEGRNADLNDLRKIQYNPLLKEEACEYIDWATQKSTLQYDKNLKSYLLDKIQYFVPYFINILLDEINSSAKKTNNREITSANVDEAFNRIIKNNDYFKDWKFRLSNYLPKDDFSFVNNILIHIAHNNQITIQEIYNIAVRFEKTEVYMDFISDLENDGYIVEYEDKYIFISPFLKEYWKHNNPIYNG